MKSIRLGRLTLSLGVAALFAGCGGSQPPIGPPKVIPQKLAVIKGGEGRANRLNPLNLRTSGADEGYTFVAQWWSSNVNGYPIKNRGDHGPTCYLGPVSFPQGLAVRSDGTLYVTSGFPTRVTSQRRQFRLICEALC